jgi:hypothetical protein
MLNIIDKPGAISKTLMRSYFENAVQNTPSLKASRSLNSVNVKGEFSHYANIHTDLMWLGFALGMRCAERIEIAKLTDSLNNDPEKKETP